MKKALLLIQDHESMINCLFRIDRLKKRTDEQLKFVERRAKGIMMDAEKEHSDIWKDIEFYLKTKNLLPKGYDQNKWVLSHGSGAMYASLKTKCRTCGELHPEEEHVDEDKYTPEAASTEEIEMVKRIILEGRVPELQGVSQVEAIEVKGEVLKLLKSLFEKELLK